MRPPGIGEILLIVLVAAVVIVGIRIFGTPSPKKTRRKPRYVEVEEYEEDEDDEEARIKKHRRSRAQILGIVAIIVGVVILLSTFSMIKWVFWGPIGAFVIMVIGMLTIFLARRR